MSVAAKCRFKISAEEIKEMAISAGGMSWGDTKMTICQNCSTINHVPFRRAYSDFNCGVCGAELLDSFL